jgi:hypothetical protein
VRSADDGSITETFDVNDLPLSPDETQTIGPTGWIKSLERSMAQVAAGRTAPLEPGLHQLRASISRMEATRSQGNPQ